MKTSKKLAMVAALIMLPMFILTSSAQKKVMLKYKLKEGSTYTNITSLDQEIIFEANEQTMSLNQEMGMKTDIDVKNVEDDNIKLITTLKTMRMEQSIFGMEIIYDSEIDSTKNNPMVKKIAESLDKLIGSTYAVIIDEKGKIIEYDLGDFSDNSDVTNNLTSGNGYANFPDHKVSVGDSWDADITPMEDSDMSYHTTYTVVKIKRKAVTLAVNSIISANKIKDMDSKIDGTIVGEMIINPKTGWTISSDMDMEMTMEMEQGGNKFPATISGNIIVESQEK